MSETGPRPIDLRPKEFESLPDAPFANDQLNRKESVESLCTVIHSAQQPLVVSVEGAYGTGKSAYLRMCAAHMEGLGALTVEFNAWQQGHTGRPLIDLVAALTAKLGTEESSAKLKTTAKQAGWRTIGYLSRGIIAPNDADDSTIFDDWAEIDAGVTAFRAALREQVSELDGKLVILVDELDRCEPTYALDLLNKARHLFDVEGVAIVFGVNRTELGHAVQTLYGPGCDVDGYLRRFVDLSMQLRQPTTDEWVAYMTGICGSLLDCTPILGDRSNIARCLLTLLADNCDGKLRDIEQVVRHANLILPLPSYKEIWPLWMTCLLTLRYVDRACYQRLVAGNADVWEVMVVMRGHLTNTEALYDMTLLDAVILLLPGDYGIPHDKDKFVERYVRVRQGETHAAAGAFEWREELQRKPFVRMPSVENLHKVIEIATPV